MRIKKGFVLREICGEKVVSAEGLELINFNKMISLNPTAAYIWENVENKDFDEVYLAHLLTDKYEVEYETAVADAKELIGIWSKNGLIE